MSALFADVHDPGGGAEHDAFDVGLVQDVEPARWDGPFYPLATRDEVRAFCRHNHIPTERADEIDVPLWLTKRGVLVRATKVTPASSPR